MSKLIRKCSITVVSIATVVSLSGAGALMPVAYALTAAEIQAQIDVLLASIKSLQAQLSAVGGAGACSFTRDLTVGVKGDDVKCLQQYLSVSPTSGYFGPLTKAAVAKWQSANGVSPAVGYFGSISRAKYNALGGVVAPVVPGVTPPVVVVPAGTGLTVTLAADQPTPTLAPRSAARIPFTKVNLTASADGDITVNSLIVERKGLGEDAALTGILLLDEKGIQLGLKKTLNSVHQATIGEAITVKAGQTRTVTVAANRATSGTRGGQTIALGVVGVNSSAAINAVFPMVGTTHTINETLTIGDVTMARGGNDPGSSRTKEIGTTGYTFSAVRVTAGSAEKVYLKSIRWNQTGSAGSADLKNVKTLVEGVAYDTVISADGKYYTSTFGDGVLLDKGAIKDISVKGDIEGGSLRTVDFDVAKMTDLFVIGENFGYGIIPPQTGTTDPTDDSAAFSNTEDPWYDASQVTVSSGTMAVSVWSTGVPAQNLAINLGGQPISGWSVEVKGEAISVSSMVVNLYESGTTNGVDDLTTIYLEDQSGKIIGGPIDVTSTAEKFAPITFTDTITFPVGITNMTLKGKLGTGFGNNDTVEASSTPSGWTATGQVTGYTITPTPSSALDGATMTAKGLALTISVQSTPAAQSLVGGTADFEFTRYTFDASQSGEDAKMSSVNLAIDFMDAGTSDKISGCQLWDGATALNTGGSNVVDPTASASSSTFTFDTPLVVPKGTSKTLSLKCDTQTVTSDTRYRWGIDTDASFTVTGLTSGQSITDTTVVPAANNSVGLAMTLTTGGSYTVVDEDTPAYRIVTPGTEVTLARLAFQAATEEVDIRAVAFQLSGIASNTPKDLLGLKVKLYDAANPTVLLGTAEFVNEKDTATSTLAAGSFKVGKGYSARKVMLVKGTIADISDEAYGNYQLVTSGDLLKVDYDGDATGLANGNYGVGSAGNITGPTTDSSLPGVRIMKSKPVFTKLALPTGVSGKIVGNGDQSVYRFSVKAEAGTVDLYKFSFYIGSSTVTATTSSYKLYGYTNSDFSGAIPGWSGTAGLLNSGTCWNGHNDVTAAAAVGTGVGAVRDRLVEIYMSEDNANCNGTTTLNVPAGSTYYFDLHATFAAVRTSTGSENVTFQLEGDAAFPTVHQAGVVSASAAGEMGQSGVSDTRGVDSDSNDDFIWSPRSTSSPSNTNLDFTNGYQVDGLPSGNMTQELLTFTL